jgi:hypothetical protein
MFYVKQNNVLAFQVSLLTLRFDCEWNRASGKGRVEQGEWNLVQADRHQNESRRWVTLLLVSLEFKAE